ncbi:NACHT domain-containing protein [Komagataeibacter swingsii]|uniref:NACHT domain-containing protein n=1 Tax=Komagataeibacter swingsii TaxID=215220 RepID=A0A2V4RI31_9PROT|nr:NACHT domain-containing protein [Komagataeibacter swingsii]PYD68594.1 hypothetical protein CFR76_14240 [Komagataeibacter swingsii]GBQ57761.1 hypothetical protein AA16373_1087 [Komagataeibacter swingsii DSM 16373]
MDLVTSSLTVGAIKNISHELNETEKQAITSFVNGIKKNLKKIPKFSQYFTGDGIDRYISYNYEKFSTTKTLLNRNTPVKISDCFVSQNFNYKNERGEQEEIDLNVFLKDTISEYPKNIINGMAGSGKTILLKYIFNESISKGYAKLPIFFEFREINYSREGKSIVKSVVDHVKNSFPSFDDELFHYGMKHGHFYLLLDGFDEISPHMRGIISKEILDLSSNYPISPILVTSRPSQDFISWYGFRQINISKFTREQTVEFIYKTSFDKEKKKEFINDINNLYSTEHNGQSFYADNKEFLSNPLLTSMMLLVFDKKNRIPHNKAVYYSKCYDVLTEEHDSTKGSFIRELYCGLKIEDLTKVFMYFCVLTYNKNIFLFIKNDLIEFINQSISKLRDEDAKKIVDRASDIIRDFCESISIMQNDGIYFEFIHRSFQEYFFAKFAFNNQVIPMERILCSILDRADVSNILSLVDSMGHGEYEKGFIMPILKKTLGKFNEKRSDKKYIVSMFFTRVLSSFGHSPYLYFSDESVPDYYNDVFFEKEEKCNPIEGFYIEVLLKHASIYYKQAYNVSETKINRCMEKMTKYNFNIKTGDSKSISLLTEFQIINSGIYDVCIALMDVLNYMNNNIEKMNNKFEGNWISEF